MLVQQQCKRKKKTRQPAEDEMHKNDKTETEMSHREKWADIQVSVSMSRYIKVVCVTPTIVLFVELLGLVHTGSWDPPIPDSTWYPLRIRVSVWCVCLRVCVCIRIAVSLKMVDPFARIFDF